MITIQRKPRVRDKVQLKNADGSNGPVIVVDLDPAVVVARFQMHQGEIVKARESGNAETVGTAVIDFFRCLFGAEQVNVMLGHYEGHWAEMIEDFYPYCMNHLYPKLKKANERRAKMMARMA